MDGRYLRYFFLYLLIATENYMAEMPVK